MGMRFLSDMEFVRIWEGARNRREVAEACDTTGPAVGMRATKLRRAGVRLKSFSRGRPRKVTDVPRLNASIGIVD